MRRSLCAAAFVAAVGLVLGDASVAAAFLAPPVGPPATTAGPLAVTYPTSVAANTAFSVTVTLKDASGNTINSSDRVYISVNRLGSQSLTLLAGTVTFNNLKAASVPASIVVTDPTRNLSRTVTIAAFVGTPPTITSANSVAFSEGAAATPFTVTTNGSPTPAVTISWAPGTAGLPAGVTFTPNPDGTGTIQGTPQAGTAGTYSVTLSAANGVSPNATQSFTLVVQPAANAIANGSFESGLNSWSVFGYVTTTEGDTVTDGTLAAEVGGSGGQPANSGALATFLGLASFNGTAGGAIQQTFTAPAGAMLTFDWRFASNDYPPFNDYGFFVLDGTLHSLADVSVTQGGGAGGAVTATSGTFSGSTPWTTLSITIPTSGTHTISFGSTNVGDTNVTSVLLVDHVRVQ